MQNCESTAVVTSELEMLWRASIRERLITKQIRQRENSGGSRRLIACACGKGSKRQAPPRWKLDVP